MTVRSLRGREANRRGRMAEFLCRLALRLKGYAVLERRLKAARGSGVGEIDLVARKGLLLAFIEVKARPSEDAAAFALRPAQRRRLERAARAYLARHPEFSGCAVRFDAMLVRPGHWPTHLIDAWREGG